MTWCCTPPAPQRSKSPRNTGCPARRREYAHTQLGVGILRGADTAQRAQIAGAVARSALLTARLAFFDLGQPAIADRCFDVALAATREVGDHALAATVLGHMAFVPAFGHQPDKARTLLAAAFQHTWHGVSPVVRSWLHCVSSEVDGRAGAGAAGRHEIDLATASIDSDTPAPEWLDFLRCWTAGVLCRVRRSRRWRPGGG